ncbi:MAG TPA: T9SS type A sorting domain-containing protein [Saprospiraceae bacterium]|nr:T9SS type A sorting domain-containing protein [Saprospiraceae bacterium]
MKINQFALVLGLLWFPLSVFSSPIFPENQSALPEKGGPCNAPAPLNFNVIQTGPTTTKYRWIATIPSVSHRVRVFRVSDNALLNSVIVPPGVSEVEIATPGNTECIGVVNAVCSDGSNSSYQVWSVPHIGFILDLVVNGYSPNMQNTDCSIQNKDDQCDFSLSAPLTQFYFKERESESYLRSFRMQQDVSTENYQLLLAGNNIGATYKVLLDGNNPNIYDGLKYSIVQVSKNETVCEFEAISSGSGGQMLNCIFMNEKYEIVREETAFTGETNEERELIDTTDKLAKIYPTPFTSSFNIDLKGVLQAETRINLYDLSGQTITSDFIPANQSSHTLSTAHLAPGFYFLRIEADGEVQTFKVIKSAQ